MLSIKCTVTTLNSNIAPQTSTLQKGSCLPATILEGEYIISNADYGWRKSNNFEHTIIKQWARYLYSLDNISYPLPCLIHFSSFFKELNHWSIKNPNPFPTPSRWKALPLGKPSNAQLTCDVLPQWDGTWVHGGNKPQAPCEKRGNHGAMKPTVFKGLQTSKLTKWFCVIIL